MKYWNSKRINRNWCRINTTFKTVSLRLLKLNKICWISSHIRINRAKVFPNLGRFKAYLSRSKGKFYFQKVLRIGALVWPKMKKTSCWNAWISASQKYWNTKNLNEIAWGFMEKSQITAKNYSICQMQKGEKWMCHLWYFISMTIAQVFIPNTPYTCKMMISTQPCFRQQNKPSTTRRRNSVNW